MKKALSALLAAFLAAGTLLTGCRKTGSSGKDSSAATTDNGYADNLPSADLDGTKFTLFMLQENAVGTWTFDSDGTSSDTISTVLYNRNRKIENRFNFTFSAVGSDGYGKTFGQIEESILADDRNYDLLAIHSYECGTGSGIIGNARFVIRKHS